MSARRSLRQAALAARQAAEPLDQKLTVMMTESDRDMLDVIARLNHENASATVRRLIREAWDRREAKP